MTDRVQVGLTEDAGRLLRELREDTPYFADEADVYRVAVAVALARDAEIPDSLKQAHFVTKFRTVRSDDDRDEELPRLDTTDRRLARMVELFHPDCGDEPYRYSQYLATIGISFLHGELIERRRTLSDVIEAVGEPASP
jgi:hypothetical protein